MLENLKIKDKDTAALVPLHPNNAQYRVYNTMELQRQRNLPIRVLIAKARQEGVSTLIEALAFTMINFHENTQAQVVSADDDSTDQVFSMTKLFQEELPPGSKRPTVRSSRKEIAYRAPHRSKFMVQTAGKDVLGRGGTVQYFHGSEVAYWPHAKEGLIGSLQQVPDVPGTIVALESTGNGVGGEFYDRYVQAVAKLKANPQNYEGFLPIFLAWHTFSSYRTPLPEGFELEPVEEEQGLQKKYGLDHQQLYWRRRTIADKCGGDEVFFKQEYPSDWRECFQASGRSVFSQTMLNKWEDRCEPGSTCVFEDDEPRVVYRSLNCWNIWSRPRPGHQYAIGIDSMEGVVSDKANERSDPDYHGAVIYNRTANEVSAVYHGRGDQQEFGEQCLRAAVFYNCAHTAMELPTGMVVLDVFKRADYPNIFHRQTHDERDSVDESDDLGWKTTTRTRPVMTNQLISFLRDSPPTAWSLDLVQEMRTFIWDKNGRPVHKPGGHDDLLFALMIAIQVHIRCPMDAVPYEYAMTGGGDISGKKRRGPEYGGGYDNFFSEADDGDSDSDFD